MFTDSKHMMVYLLLSLPILCIPCIRAMDSKEEKVDRKQWNRINPVEWDEIKNAVFLKRGQDFAQIFNKKYPQPCKNGVVELAAEFDKGSCKVWIETDPPSSEAYINGKTFKINGAIACVLSNTQNL